MPLRDPLSLLRRARPGALLFLLLCACLAGCGGQALDPAPYVARQPFPSADGPAPENAGDLLQAINRERLLHGVDPLLSDAQLTLLAERHNREMLREQRISHEHFDERFALTGSLRCVENVSRNLRTPEAVVRNWLASPDHRANLLDPKVTHAGVAFGDHYATFFACRRTEAEATPEAASKQTP